MTQSRMQCSVKTEAHAGPGHRQNHPETGQCLGVKQEKETQWQKHREARWNDAADSMEALAAHG